MQCEFCGEEIEGQPIQRDGMNFCSIECSDLMESGEHTPLDGEEILKDPDEIDDEEYDGFEEDDDENDDNGDFDIDDEITGGKSRRDVGFSDDFYDDESGY